MALLLAAFFTSGCKIWDPRTWSFKPRTKSVQRWKYEAATPYAAMMTPAAPSGIIAVNGMGYENSMGFGGDGRRMVSESSPAVEAGTTQNLFGNSLAGVDSQVRQERFGQSFAEQRTRPVEGIGNEAGRTPPPPDPFAGLPTGIPVPGKPGFVNLPEPYLGLPEVDVKGIPSGPPVEVPNPLKPAEKIRFRVP